MFVCTNYSTIVPMIPAAVIAALAIVRLGAVHTAVFGGFASRSLAQRMEATRPKVIMTASCGIEASKGPIAYQPLVQDALQISNYKPQKVLVWQRDQLRWTYQSSMQRDWQESVRNARARGIKAGPVPVKSTDPLYIISTSGMYIFISGRSSSAAAV